MPTYRVVFSKVLSLCSEATVVCESARDACALIFQLAEDMEITYTIDDHSEEFPHGFPWTESTYGQVDFVEKVGD